MNQIDTILNSEHLRTALEKYSNGEIDWDSPESRKFLEQFIGAFYLLIGESAAFMADNGIPELDKTTFISMAALGECLKKLGVENLGKIKTGGKSHENDNVTYVSNSAIKLC